MCSLSPNADFHEDRKADMFLRAGLARIDNNLYKPYLAAKVQQYFYRVYKSRLFPDDSEGDIGPCQ